YRARLQRGWCRPPPEQFPGRDFGILRMGERKQGFGVERALVLSYCGAADREQRGENKSADSERPFAAGCLAVLPHFHHPPNVRLLPPRGRLYPSSPRCRMKTVRQYGSFEMALRWRNRIAAIARF